MNHNRTSLIRICVFVIIAIQTSFICIAQTNDSISSRNPEPQSLDLPQIPEFARKTRKLINDIQLYDANGKSLKEISTGAVRVLQVLDDKYIILSDTLTKFRLDRLEKENREVSLLNERLTQWKTTLNEGLNDGEVKDSTASAMISVWQITLDTINATQKPETSLTDSLDSPNSLRTEIANYISDLQSSQEKLKIYLDSVQQFQTVIAISENKLGNISELIESKRNQLKQNIWIADSPPLWEVKSDTLRAGKTREDINFIKSYTDIILAFFNNNPKLPYHFAILFLFIYGIILFLRSKAKELYTDYAEEFKEARLVLKYPFLATLFITWFYSLFFTFFPNELNDVISILMLIPLVFMLKKLNPNWKWYTFLLFIGSYILFLLINGIDYTYILQRLLLTLVNVCILLLFLYYKKHKDRFAELIRFWYGLLPAIINLFIAIGIISLIASVLGNIQLAQLLTYVALGIIVSIHVLRTAIQLVESFVFLILMGPMMSYSNILKDDGKLILQKMDKLFRFVGFAALVYIILDLLNIRKESVSLVLNFVNYPLTVGEMSISLGNVLAFFITIQIAVWISSIIRYVLEKEVFPRAHLKQGVPNTILIMTKFTFVVLGVLLAFSAAGIQIDKLAIAMGALGVGIGFGLQNIINNFVSGIILALERPLTIGDIVDLPDVSGTVKDIGLRASTIRTWDGSDVIVPNGSLLSNKLTNWTFFDRLRRVKVDVRVPFGTNIEEVSKLLLTTANEIPEAMKKPGPYLNLKGIGTSAMEMNLYCWINDTDKIFSYGTAIRKTVYKALVDAGYDIPVPKQDLEIYSSQETEQE